MGLLDQEITELRTMNKQLIEGNIDPKMVQSRIAVYSQIEKRAKLMLQAVTLSAKYGKKYLERVEATNLIGGGCIDVGIKSIEEVVMCQAKSKSISRNECMDYSGQNDHIDECEQCPHFKTTRASCLP